jgi:hypothetical protein
VVKRLWLNTSIIVLETVVAVDIVVTGCLLANALFL